MDFDWDPAKHATVLSKRGFSFADAVAIFGGPVLVRRDDRLDYGDDRHIAVGCVGADFFTVVYTDRGAVDHHGLEIQPQGESGMAKISLADALNRPSTIDRAKLDATAEGEIRAHMIEDGFDPDEQIPDAAWRVERPPAEIRQRFGLTQERFAAFIGVPLATYRNWEQGRTSLPSGIRALFDILDREPEASRRALGHKTEAA